MQLDTPTLAGLGADTQAGDDVVGSAYGVEIRIGQTVGRFEIRDRLGAGGMGTVYAAYDPQLRRTVALKVLHPRRGDARDHHRAMLREAQAMARLNHPNVITVHDVGEHRGRVFLAMELVDGPTLGTWMTAQPRAWPQLWQVLRQAGEGLAAAHAQGLVHRDFKPDNVLLAERPGRPPRAWVTDFGIATSARDSASVSSHPAEITPTFDALSVTPTRATSLLGTPAYMAPEQHERGEVGPAADQFAFCVVLYEALFGRRPFEGDTPAMLTANIVAGRLLDPPRDRRVPAPIVRAVRRGLSVDPQRRWPSLRALLDELGRDPRRGRRRTRLAIGVAAVGAAAGMWRWAEQSTTAAACDGVADEMTEVWNPGVEAELGRVFAASPVPFATDTWQRAAPRLSAFAQTQHSDRLRVCREGRIEGIRGEAELTRATECFEEQRIRFASVVDALRGADQAMIRRAVGTAADLPDPTVCADPIALALRVPQPTDPGSRRAIARLQQRLAEVDRSFDVARYARGLQLAQDLLPETESVGWTPLVIETRLLIGGAYDGLEDDAAAAAVLETAYFEATKESLDVLALRAASALLAIETAREDLDAARRWAQLANVHFERRRGVDELELAALEDRIAVLHRHAGDLGEAVRAQTRALQIRERLLGPDHPLVANSLVNLANVHIRRHELDAAAPLLERALEIRMQTVGPDHPDTATAVGALGNVAWSRGDSQEALRRFTTALQIYRRALGPRHMRVAETLRNIGAVHIGRGEFQQGLEFTEQSLGVFTASGIDSPVQLANTLSNLAVAHANLGAPADALAAFERVLRLRRSVHGPEHPAVADALHNVGYNRLLLGHHDAALEALLAAKAMRERLLGPRHANVATSEDAIAAARLERGELDEASEAAEHALKLRQEVLEPDHPEIAYSWVSVGQIALARHDHEAAIDGFEQALSRLGPEATTMQRADAMMGLAHALTDAGRDPARAAELATEAEGIYREAGLPDPERFAELMARIEAAGPDEGPG